MLPEVIGVNRLDRRSQLADVEIAESGQWHHVEVLHARVAVLFHTGFNLVLSDFLVILEPVFKLSRLL